MKKPSHKLLRLVALAALIIGVCLFAMQTDLANDLDEDRVRLLVSDAGMWGVAVFILLFNFGLLIQLPGSLFVAAGVMVYGLALGFVWSLVAALIYVSLSFWVTRLVGGQPFAGTKTPWVLRLLDRIHSRPILITALLRLPMPTSTPLNVSLALSGIRFGDYIVGTLIGAPVTFAVVAVVVHLLV